MPSLSYRRFLKKAEPPARNITKEERKALEDIRHNQSLIVVRNSSDGSPRLQYEDTKAAECGLLQETKQGSNHEGRKTNQGRYQGTINPKGKPRRLLASESRPPRLYGLPKIHKPGNALRPIVSTCSSHTYELVKYVAKQLAPNSWNTKIFAKNSEHFIEILQQHKITKKDLLVSLPIYQWKKH
ncbi:hypothetical protein Trydic_g1990 [Trypoxylus dichotomus]